MLEACRLPSSRTMREHLMLPSAGDSDSADHLFKLLTSDTRVGSIAISHGSPYGSEVGTRLANLMLSACTSVHARIKPPLVPFSQATVESELSNQNCRLHVRVNLAGMHTLHCVTHASL